MKIVLTGGPSAGKTSVVDILHRSDWARTIVVQEAASVLYRGGFPRSQEKVQVRCQQRAIYHVQKALEEIAAYEGLNRTIVCDRGSLDGLAYWPDDEESFFKSVGSSMAKEIASYDWVIHLDTAPAEEYRSSEIRKEHVDEANLVNERVKQAWRLHPNRLIIPNKADFLIKLDVTLKAVSMISARCEASAIRSALALK